VFVSKCNLKDITDPLNTISLGGGLIMQVNMVDRGEPGNNDEIGISLYDGNQLLYSSHWTGTNTGLRYLNGGNIVVHSGFSVNPPPAARETEPVTIPLYTVNELTVRVLGNPSPSYFMLVPESNSDQPIDMKITDMNGKVLDIRRNIRTGDFVQAGDRYAVGTYFAEFIQGKQRKVVKLIKQ
jgi:hypothetical protein